MGTILLSDDPGVHDPAWGIQWLEYAARIGSDRTAHQLGKEYLRGKIVAKDTVKAMDYLMQAAEAGNPYAQYALGKFCLEEHKQENAHYWFTQAATQGNAHAQFFLDLWDNLEPPSAMLSATRLLHHIGRIFQEQTPAPSVPGSIHVDKKLMAKMREKKIMMGHKPDDHEEPIQSPTMSM